MRTNIKLVILCTLGFLVGCQSTYRGYSVDDDYVTVETNYLYTDGAVISEPSLINTYHNVHYNNRGFYPHAYYYNSGAYSMRGYRY